MQVRGIANYPHAPIPCKVLVKILVQPSERAGLMSSLRGCRGRLFLFSSQNFKQSPLLCMDECGSAAQSVVVVSRAPQKFPDTIPWLLYMIVIQLYSHRTHIYRTQPVERLWPLDFVYLSSLHPQEPSTTSTLYGFSNVSEHLRTDP